MTDFGSTYRSATTRSPAARWSCVPAHPALPAAQHGKPSALRTVLGGWAYGAIYGTGVIAAPRLTAGCGRCNHRRSDGSLSRVPPIARLDELISVPGSYT